MVLGGSYVCTYFCSSTFHKHNQKWEKNNWYSKQKTEKDSNIVSFVIDLLNCTLIEHNSFTFEYITYYNIMTSRSESCIQPQL